MFWENYVRLCRSAGMSPNKVAAEIGCSSGSVTAWKNGRLPRQATLLEIAKYFNVSVDELLKGKTSFSSFADLFGGVPLYSSKEEKRQMIEHIVDEIMQNEDLSDIHPIKTKKFRMLGKIACGKPMFAEEEFETFVEASEDINADFCVIAKGDSMINARIFDGDVVFIREQPDVENGEIAAVIIDDSVTLKRVYKYNNRIELRPENPTHKVQNYEGEELEQIRIIGKAVAFQSFII